MQRRSMILSLPLLVAAGWSAPAAAQSRDDFPFSIMAPEPGERAVRRPKAVPKRAAPAPAPKAEPSRQAQKPLPRPVRRGSSSASAIPVYRSPVTPLGTAPQVGTVQPLGHPGSPSAVVPGIQSNTGPAMTPPRPPGQSQQDRAINCVHSGTASGVGTGQIGSFTQNCVNR
jgi:hypothetical protein